MLNKIGVLTDDELKDILRELDVIAADIEKGGFTIGDEFEDVHSKIEFMLTERLGDTGKKIHTARSRNDQVLTDMHLYVRDELLHIRDGVKRLFDLLLGLSEKYKDDASAGLHPFAGGHAIVFRIVVRGICREPGGRRVHDRCGVPRG